MKNYDNLEVLRTRAKRCLPILKSLVEQKNNPELTEFVRDVLDDYMLNVCLLGRSDEE